MKQLFESIWNMPLLWFVIILSAILVPALVLFVRVYRRRSREYAEWLKEFDEQRQRVRESIEKGARAK
jgi:cytochrome c-type biogenesis protein CcmH/NrfF